MSENHCSKFKYWYYFTYIIDLDLDYREINVNSLMIVLPLHVGITDITNVIKDKISIYKTRHKQCYFS